MAILMFATVSCQDFLDRDPSDRITEIQMFSDIENAEAYLNNVYTYLPDFQYNYEDLTGRYKLADCTDEGAFQNSASLTQTPVDFNLGNWNPTQMPMQRCWADYYSCIRRCNMFIKDFDLIPDEVSAGGASNRKQRLLGEAYGLRGFYYFMLFNMWGGVPLFEKPIDIGDVSSTQDVKRATAEETVNFILADLQKAIDILPAKHDDANFGRFTSTIAYALKSRLLLYWASPYWNRTNDKTRWEAAAAAAREARTFAESNGYTLALTYESLFNKAGLENEVIWCKNSVWSESYWWDVYAYPLGYTGAFNVDSPLQEIVDDFEMQESGEVPVLGYDSKSNQIVNPKAYDYDPLHPWDGRESRFYSCILYHGAELQGRKIDISTNGLDQINIGNIPRTNYFYKKYLNTNHNMTTHSGQTYRRFAIIRTTELYLNEAEALVEAGPENIPRALALVNVIRARAKVKPIPSGLSQDEMRERIRHERRIELCFENHRFWDVRRWMIAEKVDNKAVHKVSVDDKGNITYQVYQNRVFDKSKHYLFPIPQSEIDKNRNLEQNPGW